MQRPPYRSFALRAGSLVLAVLLSSAALAAELGDVLVRSHIGQQLSADIELVLLSPEDMAGVQVRLAGANVYQGANVRMHPVLSSLRMSVVKRDNRQFLHLTTFQPVEVELLHLFLELGSGARASVRSATLWLTPDPAPAPLPAPRPQLAAPLAAAPSEAERAEQDAQAAANRAAALRAARMRAAANAARSTVGTPQETAAGEPLAAAHSGVEHTPGPAAVPIKLGREIRLPKSKTGAKGAVCAPGQLNSEAQQCLALDQTNAELKTKLIDLEGKVKQLQTALGAPVAPVAATGAVPAATAATVTNAANAANAATTASATAAGPAPTVPSVGSSAASATEPGAASVSSLTAASAAPVENKASASASSSAPSKANGKKKREAGGVNTTTMVVGSVLLLALLVGLLYYLIRSKKIAISTAPLKVWQGWRKDKAAAPAASAEAAVPEKE